MKKLPKKLKLAKETLLKLEPEALGNVVGATERTVDKTLCATNCVSGCTYCATFCATTC
jgi:hypothetical protein